MAEFKMTAMSKLRSLSFSLFELFEFVESLFLSFQEFKMAAKITL